MGDKKSRALYSTFNPTGAVPDGYIDGYFNFYRRYKKKLNSDDPDKMDYRIGSELSDSVSDAAWRKYLGLPYNEKYLPKGEPDPNYKTTYRLPSQLESEIPTDTLMLLNRIKQNSEYIRTHANVPPHVRVALDADTKAYKALKYTYETEKPVGMNEFSFNSRKWGVDNNPKGGTPPLNVLHNYNIRYDKDTNRMYYSDTYDFDGFEWWLDGTPFRFRGYVDLNK